MNTFYLINVFSNLPFTPALGLAIIFIYVAQLDSIDHLLRLCINTCCVAYFSQGVERYQPSHIEKEYGLLLVRRISSLKAQLNDLVSD